MEVIPLLRIGFRVRSGWVGEGGGRARECSFDGLSEDHEHMTTQSCMYMQFASNVLTAILGPAKLADGTVCELGYIIHKYPELSLTTTQGLAMWAALKCLWSCRNDPRFKGKRPTYNSFVTIWLARLEQWRSMPGISFSLKDLSQFDYSAAPLAPKWHPETPAYDRCEKV